MYLNLKYYFCLLLPIAQNFNFVAMEKGVSMYKFIAKRNLITKDKEHYFIDLLNRDNDLITIYVTKEVYNACDLQMGDEVPDDSVTVRYFKKGYDYIARFYFN